MRKSERTRLKDAYAVLAGIPGNRFYPKLAHFYDKRPERITCGTLACGAAWLSLHPQFARHEDEPWPLWCHRQFGNDPWLLMSVFGSRLPLFQSSYDKEVHHQRLSDKALLLYRIRRYLGQAGEHAAKCAQRDAS